MSRLSDKAKAIFLTCHLLLVIIYSVPAQRSLSSESLNMNIGEGRMMLGIKLRPKAVVLLKEVEGLFGKKVDAVFENIRVAEEASDRVGTTSLSDDGTPTIKIDISVKPEERTRIEQIICHELFHLRFRARRYPLFYFHGQSDVVKPIEIYLKHIRKSLRNSIEHWMFAPEMREMGFDPGAELKLGFTAFKQKGKSGDEDDILLALYYFSASLEYEDSILLSELKKWYVSNGWIGSLKMGERLTRTVIEASPHTPDDVRAVFMRCLDVIFGGQVKFEISRQTEEKFGSHVQPVFVVEVTLPR